MKSILSAVVGATLALSAIEANAQATPGERQVALTIETDTLASALDKWAQQSGFQIFVQDWEAAKKLPARSLKGTFAAQDALEQLLSGTPLTYVWISDKAVSIRKKMPQTVPTALQRTSLEGQGTPPISKFTGDSPRDQTGAARSESVTHRSERDAQSDIKEVEEIIVVGTNIRGIQNTTAPITVLDRAYIDSTGIATTSRLIETLPQNFALTSQSGVSVPGVSSSREQGSSINLRGIGEGTTLVLLNGRRMAPGFVGSAPDISALPLSAIDRVEVLTDGASARYGSDAIGGVVNFVLRRDFDGSDTRLRAGWASGGVNEYRASQAIGNAWSSGSALVSLEYYKRDLLPASERDFVPSAAALGSLYPEDENYSALLSGQQNLTDSVGVFLDALYTHRDSYNESGLVTLHENYQTENPQMQATGGVAWQVGADWEIETSFSYGRNDLEQVQTSDAFIANGGAALVDTLFEVESGQVKADGPTFEIPGGPIRTAVGLEWRSEKLDTESSFRSGLVGASGHFDQIVRSAFGEVHVPIVSAVNAMSGMRGLELSIAGRYDEYSNFGSSFDPQYGVMWEPIGGLRVRASYGSSYKAPKLSDYNLAFNQGLALFLPDPSAGGVTHQLRVSGRNVEGYAPQESDSLSAGLDIVPESVPELRIGVNYYRIKYRNRIANPPTADEILANPASFGDLILRDPSLQQVNDYLAIGAAGGRALLAFNPNFTPNTNFDPNTVDVIVDTRRRNLSVLKTSGIDASLHYAFDAGESHLDLGVAGTYILEIEQQVTPAAVPLDTVGTYYDPPQMRLRGSFGWQRHAWSVNMFANYTDSYVDDRVAQKKPVSSYTTVDARIACDMGAWFRTGFASGLTMSLNVQNLLDEDPPRTAIIVPSSDLGFDPTNADPMGRFIGFEVTKTW
jgi:iron complex outermembrane recepter protein